MTTREERNRLIEENLPLVGYLASDTHARATHVPREELASAGALALVTAAEAYDPSLGVPFGAYARRRILGAFADEMRSMDWASRGIRRRIKETTAVQDTLSSGLGRPATAAEIATAMGVSQEEVLAALADATRSVTTLDDVHESDLASYTPLPDEAAAVAERRTVLDHAIRALPERMRMIVHAVYIDERPVKEIAEELGVSHSAVSQQRAEAIRLLRDALERFYRDGEEAPTTSRVSASVRDGFFARIAETGGSRIARALAGSASITS
ncbi:sigma-70 family RNA polymerase sigma factor [Microbacterium esteraromaticum]|uniref:sigma-70 family RNA polymerase sigma factor n=1 Tax=Microbacterium esteraromaticum TaxID=57043 RepID=UPI00195A5760|nr:sigma-70 family RNA polymerase sigma factor [Microbacterium esteraromaticum]MBM7466791.1 RNA polymerase sigma factor for flagellar operon FliA [Microbacterium esteraromaticum]